MPAGCEFICDNKECKYFDHGFSIHGPWALGDIDEIIECKKLNSMPEVKNNLIRIKSNGAKKACIIFPNDTNIKTIGYRVQLWNSKENRIYSYDLDITVENDEEIEKLVEEEKKKLGHENKMLKNFTYTCEDGIECPHCDQLMKQNRWFANEK
jgi:protein associated with RNAse G/E